MNRPLIPFESFATTLVAVAINEAVGGPDVHGDPWAVLAGLFLLFGFLTNRYANYMDRRAG